MRDKRTYDVGIWSSAGLEDSQTMVKHLFGKYLSQLLFVMYTDRKEIPAPQEYRDEHNLSPFPMERNLANVWHKYPQYSEENTLLVSPFYNQISDFQRNDVVIPEFDPVTGKTDFHSDLHLEYLHQYLQFIVSLESIVGKDVRMRLDGYGYVQFCQRINKNLRFDSHRYDNSSDYF